MTALWIAHVNVIDPRPMVAMRRPAGPVIAAHGGVFLACGCAMCSLRERPRAQCRGAVPQRRGCGGLLQLGRISGGAGARQLAHPSAIWSWSRKILPESRG